jgi:exopolyphosphatase/guanosine-5'-triphosphate,3'-diphosphate pyrophosphatase
VTGQPPDDLPPVARSSSPAGAGDASSGMPRGARRSEDSVRVAAIDIGSNSIRQIIADVSPSGAIHVVDEMKAAPRLGTGLDASGALDEGAIARAIDALDRMATLATRMRSDRVEVVATSAVRDASNRAEFLERVEEATGLRVRVLSGEEEAHLGHLSARAHFDLAGKRAVVMDIGGGSLELALSHDGEVQHLVSLPFGALRLTEQWLGTGARPRDLPGVREFVRQALEPALPRSHWRCGMLIGSGGTFTNLAAIHLAESGLGEAGGVHGTSVDRATLERILNRLAAMTPKERAQVPGLNPARADIIVAGLAVAAEVMTRLDAPALVASGFGIREGILLESASVREAFSGSESTRKRSVRALAERCRYDRRHGEQVRRLALQLFDLLGDALGAAPDERHALADAALLHDVGYLIGHQGHHKHSYHLIVHADMLGMTPQERLIVANVARYHRGSTPRLTHENYRVLDERSRSVVVRLSALLRLADGFDRGHVSAVDQLEVERSAEEIRIRTLPSSHDVPPRLELWGAQRKRGLLEDVAGVKVVIEGAESSEP